MSNMLFNETDYLLNNREDEKEKKYLVDEMQVNVLTHIWLHSTGL